MATDPSSGQALRIADRGQQLRGQSPLPLEVHAMEVLAAIRIHVVTAKNALIKAGIEMAKLPVPMQHGLRLMKTVHELDKLAEWLQSDQAESSEAHAVRGKSKKRSRLQRKEAQSHPEPPNATNSHATPPPPIASNAADILRRGQPS